MSHGQAEIIAIGDELTSGVRLDTNSCWLAGQLEEAGLHVAFHTTVGDDLEQMLAAIRLAADRSEVVLISGGLGPTDDDLTRHSLARLLGQPLQLDAATLGHIRSMYADRNLEMPLSNEIQARFPIGSEILPNPEGTAPGIAIHSYANESKSGTCSLFALPGVPAEMKQIWSQSVRPFLDQRFGIDWTTRHFTLHCFGTGESAIAEMLPNLIERGNDPSVGITASSATISLRVSTRAASPQHCQLKMQPTIDSIRERLGDLVFGENGQELEDVVVAQLRDQQRTISVFDFGLHGEVARRLSRAEHDRSGPEVMLVGESRKAPAELNLEQFLLQRTMVVNEVGLAIGPVDRDEAKVNAGASRYRTAIRVGDQVQQRQFGYRGHSSWREVRAVKEVLNAVRLWLK